MSAEKRTFAVKVNGATKRLGEQERADLIADLRERGKTYEQISRATGLSPSNISWLCLKYGIEGPRRTKLGDRGPMVMKRGDFEVRKFTPEEDAKIIEMAIEGRSCTEIAKALGRKHNSIMGRQMTLARREERAETSEGRAE